MALFFAQIAPVFRNMITLLKCFFKFQLLILIIICRLFWILYIYRCHLWKMIVSFFLSSLYAFYFFLLPSLLLTILHFKKENGKIKKGNMKKGSFLLSSSMNRLWILWKTTLIHLFSIHNYRSPTILLCQYFNHSSRYLIWTTWLHTFFPAI